MFFVKTVLVENLYLQNLYGISFTVLIYYLEYLLSAFRFKYFFRTRIDKTPHETYT